MRNYAMYLRKSRKDIDLEALGQGETLARHRTALLELAEQQNLSISHVYEEIVSGESIADRPQMQRLLDDVYTGAYAGVLVMEIERLARGNTRDQGEVTEAFAASHTLIVTPSKTYDPDNEFDEEYFEFGLFMSRREYKTIRRRMQRGLIASIQEGNYVGSLPPYGYDIVRRNKKERTLVRNSQSPIVTQIFDWFVDDHMTCGQIARRLTDIGIPTQTGKPEWHRATIKDILQNDLYTGKVRWNRRKVTKSRSADARNKRVKHRNLSSEYLIVEGKHPALITQEQFDAAQRLFSHQAPVNANTKQINPFAGLVKCAHCGRAITYAGYANKQGHVRPRLVHVESQICKVKSCYYDDFRDTVVNSLRAAVSDFVIEREKFSLSDEIAKRQTERQTLERERKAQEQKREKLFEFMEAGIYTPDEFLERKQILTERIEKITLSLENLPDITAPDYDDKIYTYSEVIDALLDDSIAASDKSVLLKSIIDRIDFDCEDLGRGKGGRPVVNIHFIE